jgi:hypothetical protein
LKYVSHNSSEQLLIENRRDIFDGVAMGGVYICLGWKTMAESRESNAFEASRWGRKVVTFKGCSGAPHVRENMHYNAVFAAEIPKSAL